MPPEPRIIDDPREPENGNAGNNGNGDTGPTIAVPEGPPKSRRIKMLEAKLTRTYVYPAQYLLAVGTQQQIIAQQNGDQRLFDEATAMLMNVKEYAEVLVPQVVDAWADLAQRNPRVLDMLEKSAEGGSIGTLIGLHFMMAAKLLPPEVTQQFMQRVVAIVTAPFANRKARRAANGDIVS